MHGNSDSSTEGDGWLAEFEQNKTVDTERAKYQFSVGLLVITANTNTMCVQSCA